MKQQQTIYVAGHRGLVGSALCRALQAKGYTRVLTRTSKELDLCDQRAVNAFFATEKPDHVLLAAAKVGGIHANSSYPADFIRDNLLIQTNIIDAAYANGCQKLLFLGSSCIYPRLAPHPIQEESLLTGPLELTNQWYAVAKIAGIKMCQAYRRQYGFDAIAVMPTNLYGPGDNFDLATSHVVPALMRKMHEAKIAQSHSMSVWGSGTARREFMHVDDMAAACLFLMRHYSGEEIVNIGVGTDLTIKELATLIQDVVGFSGTLTYDTTMPDGTPRKLLDISRLQSLGWKPQISLQQGLSDLYAWYQKHQATIHGQTFVSDDENTGYARKPVRTPAKDTGI